MHRFQFKRCIKVLRPCINLLYILLGHYHMYAHDHTDDKCHPAILYSAPMYIHTIFLELIFSISFYTHTYCYISFVCNSIVIAHPG